MYILNIKMARPCKNFPNLNEGDFCIACDRKVYTVTQQKNGNCYWKANDGTKKKNVTYYPELLNQKRKK